ncbi:Outer membrane scaffolding protein for murein synthesis, MipA/OmpV family [Paraburkholderia phenazinium]|uniref:Outer membrane scaffolding protein for murein synthesis, MipA/OmpV family n=1 Tax=Paraburkholderia phenazinium TaxID=60549 RepID=A0A1G8LU71_9BURK|nr:MipA/OmpV family protein [Paraburkholderia phenazinium]SDI59173.1 Outer membrane scaffolding protein for murein synthesis, MipA/OmpV family [Paraburkholderia phenazinium]
MRKCLSQLSIAVLGLTCASFARAENFYMFSLAGGVLPRYEGSRDYHPFVSPVIGAEFSNGLFISPESGAGYKKTFSNGLFVSSALSYDFGRTDSNRADLPGSNYLKGMGRIPGSLIVSVQVGAHLFGNSTVSLTLEPAVTHTSHGLTGHFDVTLPVLQTITNDISITGSLHAGTGRYTQTFFGVTEAQSASSGFAPYSPKGGFDSAKVSIAWTYTFSPRWSVRTEGGLTRLLGESANSPIVQSKNNYYGMTALTYRY